MFAENANREKKYTSQLMKRAEVAPSVEPWGKDLQNYISRQTWLARSLSRAVLRILPSRRC